MPRVDPPVALAKLPNVRDLVYEITNFIDGRRSISDIRDAVSAEFGNVPLPAVVEYFERLAKAGASHCADDSALNYCNSRVYTGFSLEPVRRS